MCSCSLSAWQHCPSRVLLEGLLSLRVIPVQVSSESLHQEQGRIRAIASLLPKWTQRDVQSVATQRMQARHQEQRKSLTLLTYEMYFTVRICVQEISNIPVKIFSN